MNEFYRAVARFLAMQRDEFSAYVPRTVAEQIAKDLIESAFSDKQANQLLLQAIAKSADGDRQNKLVIIDKRLNDEE